MDGRIGSILVTVEVYSSLFVPVFETECKIGLLGGFFFGLVGRGRELLERMHVCVLDRWDIDLLFLVMMGRIRVMMMLMVCRRGMLLMVNLLVYNWGSRNHLFGFDRLFCPFLIE